MTEAYPLQWPDGWPREQNPQYSKFQTGLVQARNGLTRELERLGASDIIISSNAALNKNGEISARQPKIHDTGVAVYFTLHGEQRCLPCDKWVFLEDNVHALELTVGALRGLDRWGAKEMVDAAFRGFAALPPGDSSSVSSGWWTILDVSPEATLDEIESAYRRMVKIYHPDKGGNTHMFKLVVEAYNEAKTSY